MRFPQQAWILALVGAGSTVGVNLGESVGRIIGSAVLTFAFVLLGVAWVENRRDRRTPKNPSS